MAIFVFTANNAKYKLPIINVLQRLVSLENFNVAFIGFTIINFCIVLYFGPSRPARLKNSIDSDQLADLSLHYFQKMFEILKKKDNRVLI